MTTGRGAAEAEEGSGVGRTDGQGGARGFSRPDPASSRRSSGHVAAEYVRSLIVTGELRADERIPQDELADALQISRIPLREGLIALEREGLIRIELNRGAFVNRFDAEAVMDHYELFGLTYGLASRRAMARGVGGGLAERLAEIAESLERTADPATFRERVLEFHGVILDAARSPRIAASLRAAPRLVAGNFFAEIPGAMRAERVGLAAIIDAFRAADPVAAGDAYVAMLREQGELVVGVLTARGVFADR